MDAPVLIARVELAKLGAMEWPEVLARWEKARAWRSKATEKEREQWGAEYRALEWAVGLVQELDEKLRLDRMRRIEYDGRRRKG